jgi:glycosyltransferase involved in cell wall biosynthesis
LRNELINNYHFKGEVTVIQNGIDIHKFKPNKAAVDIGVEKSGKTRILFSGRLIALKGPQFVIKAMPLVLRQYPEVVFIFAGPGNRTPYLQMLRDLKIPEKNFEFCHLSYENMPQLYNSADILVLPSLTEGFPKCILEGMACGLPVIASDVGDVSELVHDGSTGFLISKGDYKTLADRINLLQSNENLRHQMSLDARSMVVANYSVDVMSQKTLDTYQKCIGCSAK